MKSTLSQVCGYLVDKTVSLPQREPGHLFAMTGASDERDLYLVTRETAGCGNTLRALTTTYLKETSHNTRGNDLGHSNNVKDWAIRRREPNPYWIWYGSDSEIAKQLAGGVIHSDESLRYDPRLLGNRRINVKDPYG